MNLAARSTLPEVMDEPGLDEAVYQACLADLAALNRVTMTHFAVLTWLNRATRALLPGARISILDVAYGQGDLLRALARWADKRGFNASLSGIDLNPRSRAAALAATPGHYDIAYFTGDVFDFTPVSPPDYIVSSQFTHHLPEAQLVRLLRWLQAHAVRGWHITDLHRHIVAYYGFPLLARLMRWHEIVRHDGQVSIARGFTGQDWAMLLAQAGVSAEIRWRVPFRHSVSYLA